MNAILASSSSSDASATFDLITQRLAALAQASAQCEEVLTRMRPFRQMAATLLRELIDAIRESQGLPVSNPDAIFLNRPETDGALSTMAMTDVLIDVARREKPVLDAAGGVFCSRHDSIDPAHAFTPEQNRTLKALIDELAPSLTALYASELSDFWRRATPDPTDSQRTDTPDRLLIELHRTVLLGEIALHGDDKLISPDEQARLIGLLEADAPQGVFTLSWMTADQTSVMVPSVYCIGASADDEEQPSGAVFLLMPGRGIERFDSLDSLRQVLTHRLTATDASQGLREAMSLASQARLSEVDVADALVWSFKALRAPMLDTHVQSLQLKQREDFEFVLQADPSATSVEALTARIDRITTCAHLDDAMGHRFSSLTMKMALRVQPHWRKYGREDKQAELAELEQVHDQRKKCVEERLQGLESLERFARDEITAYIRRQLGCFIDPDSVQVSFDDVINLNGSDSLSATYKKSLLEFAVQGAPDGGAKLTFAPVPERLHAEFSEGFVRTMLQELKLARRYAQALAQRYADEETLRLMVGHRDSAIALGACRAQMQGHLVQDRSHQMLCMIRGDQAKDGSEYSMGSLHLRQTGIRFKDVIVFVERTGSDEHWVLYAPGAAGGQDFYEYGAWRQLVLGIGQWLATDAGRTYVHEQLAGPGEHAHGDFLHHVALKPSLWTIDSCEFVPCTGETFQRKLADLVERKASLVVQAADSLAPGTHALEVYANPSVVAFVEARVEALDAEFCRLTPQLLPFSDYVHQHTSQALNEFLRSQGYAREIDPDTLYLGLGLPFADTPDFSEHSSLHSFTSLMMYGAEDIVSYRPDIHLYSSTGLDVTQLPVNIIHFLDRQVREADLGARYITALKREFLLHDNPLYSRRQALLAKRIQYQMIRGALKAFLRGHLDEQQYTWLRQTIAAFGSGHTVPNSNSRVCAFKIAGQVIEGVYIVRDFDTEDSRFNLLYLPDSPDGVFFRPLSDYARILESSAMQSYCYARVAYSGQPLVGTFLDELARGKKHDPDFIRIHYDIYDAISSARGLYADMLVRLIRDVDAQTESTAEKRLSLAWTIIRWTGTILLLPFPVASLGWGVLTSSVTLVQAADAYLSGDRATALPLLVFGVLGLVSAGDGVRSILIGSQTVLANVALKAGGWAWRKLELGRAFQVPTGLMHSLT